MAKGNMLLGYSRGAVGDVVFTRSKGQQIARARNRNPKNPKTKAQMAQRIKFASVVEFFRRGNQNLFQFAFENKGAKQSDYNAFVSANADKGIFLTPAQLKNPKFPIVNDFIVSAGSLSRAGQISIPSGGTKPVYELGTYAGTAAFDPAQTSGIKMSMISEFFVKKGFQNGDIVTFLGIVTHVEEIESSSNPAGKIGNTLFEKPSWIIAQFKVDTTNNYNYNIEGVSMMIDNPGDPETPSFVEGWTGLRVTMNYPVAAGSVDAVQAHAIAVIVSRNEPEGLKVSNSQLFGDSKWNDVKSYYSDEDVAEGVIEEWGASEEAILMGSLSD